MRTFFSTCLITIIFFATACKNKPKPEAGNEDGEPKKIIPYTALLREQVQYVDSTPLIIYKYVLTGGRTDTSFIDRDAFKKLAQEFLEPDITQATIKEKYTINSFGDNTTGLAVFSYETTDSLAPVKLVNLRFKPTDGNSKFTSLDITKSQQYNDTLVIKKLFWKSGHFFHIITSKLLKDSLVGEQKEVITWNPEPGEPEITAPDIKLQK